MSNQIIINQNDEPRILGEVEPVEQKIWRPEAVKPITKKYIVDTLFRFGLNVIDVFFLEKVDNYHIRAEANGRAIILYAHQDWIDTMARLSGGESPIKRIEAGKDFIDNSTY